MRTYERLGYILGVILVFVVLIVGLSRLAHSTGAPIPTRVLLIDRVPVRNACCVMVWTAKKQWRNDRVFAWSN